jgi:hypothetical protein
MRRRASSGLIPKKEFICQFVSIVFLRSRLLRTSRGRLQRLPAQPPAAYLPHRLHLLQA